MILFDFVFGWYVFVYDVVYSVPECKWLCMLCLCCLYDFVILCMIVYACWFCMFWNDVYCLYDFVCVCMMLNDCVWLCLIVHDCDECEWFVYVCACMIVYGYIWFCFMVYVVCIMCVWFVYDADDCAWFGVWLKYFCF